MSICGFIFLQKIMKLKEYKNDINIKKWIASIVISSFLVWCWWWGSSSSTETNTDSTDKSTTINVMIDQ